jgi:hypothetical protein
MGAFARRKVRREPDQRCDSGRIGRQIGKQQRRAEGHRARRRISANHRN